MSYGWYRALHSTRKASGGAYFDVYNSVDGSREDTSTLKIPS